MTQQLSLESAANVQKWCTVETAQKVTSKLYGTGRLSPVAGEVAAAKHKPWIHDEIEFGIYEKLNYGQFICKVYSSVCNEVQCTKRHD